MKRLSAIAVAGGLLACGARTDLGVSGLSFDGGVSPLGDAAPAQDGAPDAANPCPLPIETAYLLDDVGAIYRYDPVPAKATLLGTPDCSNGNVQWTATFSRQHAYIVYTGDWTIYAVDLATMACAPTPFQPGQLGIGAEFGVAISASGGTERLYVYGEDDAGGNPILAVADLGSFVLTKVGAVTPAPPADAFPVNLTADPLTGQLYAFSAGGYLQKIDPTTGAVSLATTTTVATLSTWANVVFLGTDYLFVGDAVYGYDLSQDSITSMHTPGINPVGGGAVLSCQ